MASSIDPTKPTAGTATTQSVRDNFSAAKTEIEALQSTDHAAVTLAGQDYLTLSTQQITANKIALDDLADGTDGELITWDAAGSPAAVGVGTSGQVLTSNGAGAAPTFQAAAGGGDTDHLAQFISGIVPSWTDANTIAWTAGKATVNGTKETYAGGNTGNLGQSDAGLSATGIWYHYLHSGGIELSQTVPVADTHTLFFQKTGDATRRLIGYHYVWDNGGTRQIGEFWVSGNNYQQDYHYYFQTPCRVSTSTSTTMLSTDCSAIVPDAVICNRIAMAIKLEGDNGEDLAGYAHSVSPGSNSRSSIAVRATYGRSSGAGYTFFGHTYLNIVDETAVYLGVGNNSGTINAALFDVMGTVINR